MDNVVVILDASASMRTWYDGSNRLEVAKAIISRMNQTVPDLDLDGALRTFGHSSSVSTQETDLMYGLTAYKKSGLQAGLDKVAKADGLSPLGAAIDAVNKDLQGISDKTALIIVSDGEAMGKTPLEAAQRLKQDYAGNLCIYTISVGSNPGEKNLLRELAQTGECGYATDANEISTSAGMYAYVERMCSWPNEWMTTMMAFITSRTTAQKHLRV